MNNYRILLLGGSGYLGTHLFNFLKKSGFEVYYTGTSHNLDSNYYRIDFEDSSTFKNCHIKFDLVIVLASKLTAISSKNLNHPDLSINTIGYSSFLEYLKAFGLIKKLIYISSMTVYSINAKSPVKENDKLEPPHVYGLSKLMAEKCTEFFARVNSIPSVILRLPGIYGGDRRSGFIYNVISSLINKEIFVADLKGLDYWESIHIDDLCSSINKFVIKYKWDQNFNIYNVSYGEKTDIIDTALFIEKELKIKNKVKIKNAGYSSIYLSNNRLEKIVAIENDYYGKLKNYISSFRE